MAAVRTKWGQSEDEVRTTRGKSGTIVVRFVVILPGRPKNRWASSVRSGGRGKFRDFQGYSLRSKFGPHIFFSPLESSLTSYNPGKRCGVFFCFFFSSEVKITCFSFLAYFSLSFIWHRRNACEKKCAARIYFSGRHCDGVIKKIETNKPKS